MSRNSQNNTLAEKRLKRAVQHVSDYWFPVNNTLLHKIQSGLQDGSYDQSLFELVSEIKSDFSLFTYCLLRLVRMLSAEGFQFQQDFQPVQLMRDSGLERLKVILSVKQEDLSKHRMPEGSDEQLARFNEAMLSASTAQEIANSTDIDCDTAYSSALLRQLGLTLVAWNYPGVYKEALASLEAGISLELALAQELGFSPSLLALRVLHEWSVPKDICRSLGLIDDAALDEEEDLQNQIGSRLVNICKVGEALARANNPGTYPSAKDDWHYAELEIGKHLGDSGLKLIRNRYLENCEHYLTYVPEAFQSELLEHPELFGQRIADAEQNDNSFIEQNPFIQLCEADLIIALRRLYNYIPKEGCERECLRQLATEVFSKTGFCSGVIYTIDPALMILVAQTGFGDLTDAKLDPINYSIIQSNANLIAVAYQSLDLVTEPFKSSTDIQCIRVAGAIGVSQRVGVLSLEIPADLYAGCNGQHNLHYRAFRQALNDVLRV